MPTANGALNSSNLVNEVVNNKFENENSTITTKTPALANFLKETNNRSVKVKGKTKTLITTTTPPQLMPTTNTVTPFAIENLTTATQMPQSFTMLLNSLAQQATPTATTTSILDQKSPNMSSGNDFFDFNKTILAFANAAQQQNLNTGIDFGFDFQKFFTSQAMAATAAASMSGTSSRLGFPNGLFKAEEDGEENPHGNYYNLINQILNKAILFNK